MNITVGGLLKRISNSVYSNKINIEYYDIYDEFKNLNINHYTLSLLIKAEKDTIKPKPLERFDTTGDTKLFDKKRRLWKEGYFEDGKLMKGKIYYYKSDTVYKTVIIKDGKIHKTIKK